MNRFSSLPEGRSDGALQIASNPRTRRSGPTRDRLAPLGNLAWPRLEGSPRIRKVDGRRSEGGGDTRKVVGRCLPSASRNRELRALDDRRLKSTSEGVLATVRRWAAGTEGGAKAPACDRRANFIEGVMGVINFNRILRDLSATLTVLAVPRLTVGGPSPQPGAQQAEQLRRRVDAINSALDGLVFVVAHAAVVAAHVVVVAAPAMTLVWVLAKVGAQPG